MSDLMNTARIIEAARMIAERTKALSWLEEYGRALTGRDNDVSVSVALKFAGSVDGAKEAGSLLNSYATLDIPQVVLRAIDCCRNDIGIYRSQIAEELEKAQS